MDCFGRGSERWPSVQNYAVRQPGISQSGLLNPVAKA
jgi:hypothetical protein